nr:unnamed protein product [Callosobruchus chinensis]
MYVEAASAEVKINTVVDYIYVACFLSASLGEMFLFTYCCQTLSLECNFTSVTTPLKSIICITGPL